MATLHTKSVRYDQDAMQWPPVMPTRLASAYCGYITPWGFRSAYHRGLVKPCGKRGRSLTWRREDLDAFMRGGTCDAGSEPAAARLIEGAWDRAERAPVVEAPRPAGRSKAPTAAERRAQVEAERAAALRDIASVRIPNDE